jgi:acetyltransferase-like isoleucine patch superfamily enzyme
MSLKNILRRLAHGAIESLPQGLWGPAHAIASGRKGLRRRFLAQRVGPGSYVDPTVMIFGWRNVRVGHHTTIGEQVWLNANFRHDPGKQIVIGNNCHVSRGSYFSCGPGIELKDYCFIGFNCNLLGCGHRFDSPLVPYIASGLYAGDVIEIGVNCWLTGNVTVLEGVRIGCGSVIGASTVVTRDIAPFSLAVGNPCRVIRRFDFASNSWIDAQQWSAVHERALPSEQDYLATLLLKYPTIQPSRITSGARFGWL